MGESIILGIISESPPIFSYFFASCPLLPAIFAILPKKFFLVIDSFS
jgi:hypothetical protein